LIFRDADEFANGRIAHIHARRSATRVNSAGMSDCRKAMMSVSAVIATIDGKRAASNSSFFAASGPSRGTTVSMPVEAASDLGAVFASCSNRAQRRKTLLVSVTARSPYSTRRPLIALALDEGTVDMMLGYKQPDDFGELARHKNLIDKIVARIGESFAFRWISGDSRQFI
jgi:hypothetical protein